MKNIYIESKTLFFDTDILFLDVPILRVYRHSDNSFFVFSCIDPDDYIYLAFETTRQKLIQMLSGERKLLDIFMDVSNSIHYIVEFDIDFSVKKYQILKKDEVPYDYLPVEGKSLKLMHDKEIRDYVTKLKLEEKNIDIVKWNFVIESFVHLDYKSFEKILKSRWAYRLASEELVSQYGQNVSIQKSQPKLIYVGIKHSKEKITYGQIPRERLAEGKHAFAELKN